MYDSDAVGVREVLPAGGLPGAPSFVRRTVPAHLAPRAVRIDEADAQERSKIRHLPVSGAGVVDAFRHRPQGVHGLRAQGEVIDPPALEDRQFALGTS